MHTLADLFADYQLARRMRQGSIYQIGRTIALFEQFLGRDGKSGDLNAESVNRWLEQLERRYSQRTVAGHRVNLLSIWRDAADRGICHGPARVRKVPRPAPMPVAWTLDELSRLMRVAESFQGTLPSGASKALYFSTLLAAAYDTGLRRSDLWSLRRDQILPNGTIAIVQRKTATPHFPSLRPETLAKLQRLPGDTPLKWHGDERRFYDEWRSMLVIADVREGALQRVRRTGATAVMLATRNPEHVRLYLGHSTHQMQRHYVDQSLLGGHGILPPAMNQ